MTTTRSRLQGIFDSIVDCSEPERSKALKDLSVEDAPLRAELMSLLAASDAAGDFLGVSLAHRHFSPEQILNKHPTNDADSPQLSKARQPRVQTESGDQLGPYRLVRQLGRGGMGVVYLAERIDGVYTEHVALKILDAGQDAASIERFHIERQVLANLQHPNIAHLLNGGTSDEGHSFLVMEYIEGLPVNDYCQNKRLSIKEILELFVTVCEAVQFAHQNLIVHRDLKPEHVLITEQGQPKLLDFGVAKLLPTSASASVTPTTRFGIAPFTPEYAAPEQLSALPVTTATDVYALGGILYELLSTCRPHDCEEGNLSDLVHAICNKDVRPPSEKAPPQLKTTLRGDLDNIVTKALCISPMDRYQSAYAMLSDIRNYIDSRPVSASRPTPAYAAKKFFIRHRRSLSAGVMVAIMLLVAVVATTWQWQVAQTERELAQSRLGDIKQLTNTIVFDLPVALKSMRGSTRQRARLVEQGIAYLDVVVQQEPGDPELVLSLAKAYYELAMVQGIPSLPNLGRMPDSRQSLRKSLSLLRRLMAMHPDDVEVAINASKTLRKLGTVSVRNLEQHTAGLMYTHEAIRVLQPFVSLRSEKVLAVHVRAHIFSAFIAERGGDMPLVNHHLEQAHALLSRYSPAHPFKRTQTVHRLRARLNEEWAKLAAVNNKPELALAHEQTRLSLLRRVPVGARGKSADSPAKKRVLGWAFQALGARQFALGQHDAAIESYQTALAGWRALRRKHPADATANEAIAVIHAELADIHWRTPTTSTNPRTIVVQRTCDAYRASIASLNSLSNPEANFATRYPWSPSTQDIYRSKSEICDTALISQRAQSPVEFH